MIYTKKKKETPFRPCDHPGCTENGQFKAPKDRNLNDYYWFCLKHVTEYNKNWDFYKGLSPKEIEEHIQNDITWQRPTWRLGQNQSFRIKADRLKDSFKLFDETDLGMSGKHNPPAKHEPKAGKRLMAAVEFLEAQFPLKLEEVKKQYKKLAKQYHPDTNPNDKDAEKMFKLLQEHYRYILEYLGESQ